MPVASMTGFARTEGEAAGAALVWELRSVNGKGLDLRLRLPPGFDALEPEIRRLAAARLSRGNLQISLQLRGASAPGSIAVNEDVLARFVALADELVRGGHAVQPSADGLLALRGVIESGESASATAPEEPLRQAALHAFGGALDALVAARAAEGARLAEALGLRLDEMEALASAAEADPSRSAGAIAERLRAQVGALLSAGTPVDEARLAQEAAILATKADIREELDRLSAHIAAARALLAAEGPVGRKLDFLSQEFNRESNTICSKSNSSSLTRTGLELKVVIDQFREQVQNIE
ncbi:YicC/YloC family endoribonuclease [Aureimonas populi]|uniref:YicC/YloC family endoribonuclease n=1 Tax=Aureimonas populi TaxID=1701758 RepID=A0ABW5CH30_9HYPH|nr:YicC/YloC family endoribonuclease [Aureimonas populi]